MIGAFNTIIVRDGKLYGENTDGKGFVDGLKANGICLEGKKQVLLGTGGAARVISVECALVGVGELTIICGTLSKGENIAKIVNENTACKAKAVLWTSKIAVPKCNILINATNIGLYSDVSVPDIDYDTLLTLLQKGIYFILVFTTLVNSVQWWEN